MRRRAARTVARVAALLLAAAASPASGDWLDFLPRPFEKRAYLETYASFERDRSRGDASGIRWDDTFFRERLRLESNGYSYDPRFLLYHLSVAGSGKQELYDSSAYASKDWDLDGAIEYDARLVFLPEHPYSLEAFAARYEPVYRQQAATSRDSVMSNYGGTLRYERKPWFLHGTFVDTRLDSAGNSAEIKNLNLDAKWFKRFANGYETTVNGSFNPSWYDNSQGLEGSSIEYVAGNLLNLKRLRLSSNVSQNTFDQRQDAFDRYETDQLAWWELLSVYLPWKFRTDFAYRHHDDESTVDDLGPAPARRYANDGDNIQIDVIHRLYDSLDTRYRFVSDTRDSTNGSSDTLSNGLSLDYTKQIPHGRLMAGMNLNRSDLDNAGFADVVNDPYTATAVPGTFALRQINVDPSSVVVVLRSPLPPFDTIPLVQGLHYQLNTALEPFEIQVTSLPPEFLTPGNFDLFVSYSMTSGEYELRTDNAGANLSFAMFDNRVTPYFRYLAQRSEVRSGTYPGPPIDSDSYTAGVRLLFGPFRARGEHQTLDWEVNPWRAWRAEVQYVGAVTRSITAYATASYLNRHYLGGDPPYSTIDFTEEVVTISGNVTKQFWSRHLYITIGGAWTHLTGLSDSDAWSANSSLVWHVGKLDLSIGISAFGSDSTTGLNPSVERDHQLFSVNVRRQLL
jgi:hypothetical protein